MTKLSAFKYNRFKLSYSRMNARTTKKEQASITNNLAN